MRAPLLLVCAMLACSEGSVVDLTIEGLGSGVTALQITPLRGGRPALGSRTIGRSERAEVLLPLDAVAGLRLRIGARGRDECQVQGGEAEVRETGPGRGAAAVRLAEDPGCRVRVRQLVDQGGGGGIITMRGADQGACTVTCQPGGGADCGACAFALGAQVTLSARSDGGGYFVGWSRPDCPGVEDCSVRVTNEPIDVQAGFLPRRACLADGWCWENPLLQGNPFQAVWGAGPGDVWAVGALGTVLRWNGSLWVPYRSGTTASLNGVAGAAADDVWLVGAGGLVLRWDGRRFQAQASGVHVDLHAIWVGGPDQLWIAGDRGTILRWDGRALVAEDTGVADDVLVLWGVDGELWAAGRAGALLRRVDGAWRRVPSGTRDDLRGLWGSAANDLWLTSASPTVPGRVRIHWGTVRHWDGVQVTRTQVLPDELAGVYGTRRDSVWIAATNGHIYHLQRDGRFLPRDTDRLAQLHALWGADAEDAWAVGEGGLVLRWDGVRWASQDTSSRDPMWDVLGDGEAVYAISAGGHILRREGRSWYPGIGTGVAHQSAWSSGAGELWAVGNVGPMTGAYTRVRGIEYASLLSGTGPLVSAWGVGARIWAVGSAGAVLSRDGDRLVPVNDPVIKGLSAVSFTAVFGTGPDDVWVVGLMDTILHYTGGRWTQVPRPIAGGTLYGLWAQGDDVWMVGAEGTVLRLKDPASVPPPPPRDNGEPRDLYTIWGLGPEEIWVGDQDGVLRWDGKAWHVATFGAGIEINGLWGSRADGLWAVGKGGAILHRPVQP